MKKPSALQAWCASITAILSLCAFVFIVNATTQEFRLAIAGITVIIASLLAISCWKRYFQNTLDHRVRSLDQNKAG